MLTEAYVGIDVAFAKKKRLPVCVSVLQEGSLIPLPLRHHDLKPPLGSGNRAALDSNVRQTFARDVRDYLRGVERAEGVSIRKVAIDAPSAPRRSGITRRAAERAMDHRHINCFATPSSEEFESIVSRARRHLDDGGSETRIPHANQIWMLVGLALFDVLGGDYECMEVFPQAIVARLGISKIHKSERAGFEAQLAGVAEATGWPRSRQATELDKIGYGSRHDKLDACLSAWMTSLPEHRLEPCGVVPDDVIWVPRSSLRPQ